MKQVLTLLLLILSCFAGFGSDKHTYVYNIAGSDTLRLDFYKALTETPAPVVVFAFGGGFKGGERDNKEYIPMFEYLSDNGVSVASIDYRTLLKSVPPQTLMSPDGFKASLIAAIDTAVTDLLRATSYIDANSAKLNIDPKQIFTLGSSAGAITVLQAEYDICNSAVSLPSFGLPAEFNYAGVISMAGAVYAEGFPHLDTVPCPILLFHGDADSVVPFDKAVLGDFGLWGSNTLAGILSEKTIPHRFHRVNGASHEIATRPMTEDRGEILDFIRAVCNFEAGNIVNTVESTPGLTDYRTDFTILDYIKSNL